VRGLRWSSSAGAGTKSLLAEQIADPKRRVTAGAQKNLVARDLGSATKPGTNTESKADHAASFDSVKDNPEKMTG
jgi:hypothetical protein